MLFEHSEKKLHKILALQHHGKFSTISVVKVYAN